MGHRFCCLPEIHFMPVQVIDCTVGLMKMLISTGRKEMFLYMIILCRTYGKKEGKKMFYLMMHSTHFNAVIWHRTYGKGPFR